MKPGHTGLYRLYKASGYSIQGFKAAWKYESAIRQEVIMLMILIPIALIFGQSAIEKSLLIASIVLVLIVELLNAAIEAVVDRVGSEYHELSGRAKDIGSCAVLVTLILAASVWTLILLTN
ncbi:diacylglycerol kinase [uncultured Photobacterium sp.]|uniref:diacylglycerol kinase n=1 Tax=uncultured Photobacterium sp. TaxID=173973 RepID=UPI00261C7FF6|nr:diacylglycerol kinase [uncultured Photobacterium sp.]